MTRQHPNDVLVHEGWKVVRNESPYNMYGSKKKMIWFTLYHDHEGPDRNFRGMCTTRRSAGPSDGSYMCDNCTEQAPDVVQGYMNLIEWSMNDADA